MNKLFNKRRSRAETARAVIVFAALGAMPFASMAQVSNPNGMIDLKVAPKKVFTGRIFFQNDWNFGDEDNINVGLELNRNSKIKQGVTVLTMVPRSNPSRVTVNGVVKWPAVLADASQSGKVAFVLGGVSKQALEWLTILPKSRYNYHNIVLVSHSNYNESDGAVTKDTHGEDLRRGTYPNLAKISDLGVTIWEIPRTDHGNAGWGGGSISGPNGKNNVAVKSLDISDLGSVHYLKTGILNATRWQRNAYVSNQLKKASTLDNVKRPLITKYWDSNRNVPGVKKDYLPGGKFY